MKRKRSLALALVLALCFSLLPGYARATGALENWNNKHTYGELKRFVDGGGTAYFNSDGTNPVKEFEATELYDGTFQLHVVGTDDKGDYTGTYNPPTENIDFDVYVPKGSTVPGLHFKYKD